MCRYNNAQVFVCHAIVFVAVLLFMGIVPRNCFAQHLWGDNYAGPNIYTTSGSTNSGYAVGMAIGQLQDNDTAGSGLCYCESMVTAWKEPTSSSVSANATWQNGEDGDTDYWAGTGTPTAFTASTFNIELTSTSAVSANPDDVADAYASTNHTSASCVLPSSPVTPSGSSSYSGSSMSYYDGSEYLATLSSDMSSMDTKLSVPTSFVDSEPYSYIGVDLEFWSFHESDYFTEYADAYGDDVTIDLSADNQASVTGTGSATAVAMNSTIGIIE